MQNIHPVSRSRRTRGVTLVECLCAISILTTTVGLAMPNLKSWRERQALLSAAAELETDIQYARSQAVAHNTAIHFTVRATSGGACYVVHTGDADDCTCTSDNGPICTSNAAMLRHTAYPERGVVKLLLNRDATLTFNPRLGTVTPTATFKLKAPSATVHQIVSIMGRTRSCSPDKISGIRAC
jgi:type IV fimbrial biogenesis protein FimT